MLEDDLSNRFSFHPANTQSKQRLHGDIRQHCYILALHLNDMLPEGREKSLAITRLEEVMFWSNAAIAREEDEYVPEHTYEEERDDSGPIS